MKTIKKKKKQKLNLVCDAKLIHQSKLIYQQKINTLLDKYDHKTIESLFDFAVKQGKQRTKNKKSNDDNWIFCDSKSNCYQILKEGITIEVQSTYYWLRLLSDIIINGHIKVEWKSKSKLTGKWEDDSKHISIETGVKKGNKFRSNQLSRCVLIFGPSAAGKTYWTKETLKNILPIYYDNFPHSFITIDGGNMREISLIYQIIIQTCKKNNIKGLTNLVKVNLKDIIKCKINKNSPYCSLFTSTLIKSQLKKFLEDQIKKYHIKIPLVIPETFTDYELLRIKSFGKKVVYKKFKKWLEISDSTKNWIGIMVWQHKKNCPYPPKLKCVGTIKSGRSRELLEGKKYSSSAYKISMKSGKTYLTSPGISLSIHNSGIKKRKSVVEINYKKGDDIEKLNKIKTYLTGTNLADCKIVDHK